MVTDNLLQRINQLAKKAKKSGLNKSEKEEQTKLRKEYLKKFRQSFKKQIQSVKVVDPKGEDVTPDKIKQRQKDDPPHRS